MRIGLLISRLDRGLHRTAWLSVAKTAQRHGVDAICFDGGVLAPDDELARKNNALYDPIRAEIKALTEAGLLDQVKVMIGGAPVTDGFAKQIGADGYSPDASAAVRLAKGLIG